MSATRSRTRAPALDHACAEAVELARSAAVELSGAELVGEHLGVVPDGDRVATHYFACLDPAYRGWRWSVTVARASRARNVTVDENVLLPGDEAMLAPDWVPWKERLRPGDLGPGDLLPTLPDDDRLVPGLTDALGEDAPLTEWELGLGRARVLSSTGRDDAADRWYSGDPGPQSPIAHAAPMQCSTCGFHVGLVGALGQVFGVCANEYAPDDGRVVSADHGCGAHSEIVLPPASNEPPPPIVDELGYDIVHTQGSVDETAAEPLGHS